MHILLGYSIPVLTIHLLAFYDLAVILFPLRTPHFDTDMELRTDLL